MKNEYWRIIFKNNTTLQEYKTNGYIRATVKYQKISEGLWRVTSSVIEIIPMGFDKILMKPVNEYLDTKQIAIKVYDEIKKFIDKNYFKR